MKSSTIPQFSTQSLLDAWEVPVCIIDSVGFILVVNTRWQEFTVEVGLNHPDFALGMNYFHLGLNPPGKITPIPTSSPQVPSFMVVHGNPLPQPQDRFQSVIQNIDAHIYIMDVENKKIIPRFHSPQCFKITGYTSDQFMSDPDLWFKMTPPDDMDKVKKFFEDNCKGMAPPPLEHRIITKKGETRWVLNHCVPVNESKENSSHLEGFVIDITDRVLMEYHLREVMNLAEMANKAKSDFLASMSHEMRTPLNAILGFSQILGLKETGGLTEKQQGFLQNIQISGNHMLQMISDTLDLAKIEAGKEVLNLKPFDLTMTLNRIIETMEILGKKNQITLVSHLAQDLGILEGDEIKFRQIVYNLLSNALKFTPPGKKIGLDAWGDQEKVVLVFWDEGIGIALKDQKRIFEPFEQVRVRRISKMGSGLGLNITQHLVKMHGGTLVLESSLDSGTRFTITLPGRITGELKSNRPPTQDIGSEFLANAPPKKITGKILIVEDSPLNQELMKSILELLDCGFYLAVDGEQAVKKASSEKFDLILMDIDLPGIDGLEALRQIRISTGKNTPIIALTAHAMKGDKERFLEAGMSGVLLKPINFYQMKEVLREYSPGTCSDELLEEPGLSETKKSPYDLDQVAKSLGIPTADLFALIQRFFEVLAKDYLEALYQGITHRDHQVIQYAAHKFRGAVASLRFERCSQLLMTIEKSADLAQDINYLVLFTELQREIKALQDEITP